MNWTLQVTLANTFWSPSNDCLAGPSAKIRNTGKLYSLQNCHFALHQIFPICLFLVLAGTVWDFPYYLPSICKYFPCLADTAKLEAALQTLSVTHGLPKCVFECPKFGFIYMVVFKVMAMWSSATKGAIWRKRISHWINELITKVFVEQSKLHRVSQIYTRNSSERIRPPHWAQESTEIKSLH